MAVTKYIDVVTWNADPVKRGDTTDAIKFTLVDSAYPDNLNGATIDMWIKNRQTGAIVAKFSTTDNTMSITDADLCKFQLNKYLCLFAAADCVYDVQIKYSNGDFKTRFEGTYTITEDVTKKYV